MDAFVVSKLIKNSLQPVKTEKYFKNKKVREHATFMSPNDAFTFGADGSVKQSMGAMDSPMGSSMGSMGSNMASMTGVANMQPMSMPPELPEDADETSTTNNISITKIEVTNVGVDDERQEMVQKSKAERLSMTTFILMLFINSYAAYLSWDCNTKNNYPLSLKIVFSLFALTFGSFYLLYYILFRFDTCNKF